MQTVPLLAGGHSLAVPSLQGRFVSPDFYDEKRKVFRKYNSESWKDTLAVHIPSFMAMPLGALVDV